MTHLPQFLQALDLGLDADERAVRRAYARRLKQIDQAADPQGFQALRSIYESALQWVAMQHHEEAVAATTAETLEPPRDEPAEHREDVATGPLVEPAQGNVPEMPAALALGEQVYAEFAATAAGVFKDEDAARKALAQALSDARLVNLESRTFFEWRVACLIVEGWRPGLEYLFGPACSSFNWDQDRRRLALFGEVGGTLDAAINERLIFFRQDPRQFEEMRQTIRRLRSEERPEKRLLLAEIPRVELLIQRYPNWLRLVTSRTHIIQWRQWHEEIPLAERHKNETLIDPVLKQPQAKSGSSSIPWWGICFGVFVVLKAIGGLMETPAQRSVPQITSPPPVVSTLPTPATDPRVQVRPLGTGIQQSLDDPHVGNAPREPLRAVGWPSCGSRDAAGAVRDGLDARAVAIAADVERARTCRGCSASAQAEAARAGDDRQRALRQGGRFLRRRRCREPQRGQLRDVEGRRPAARLWVRVQRQASEGVH